MFSTYDVTYDITQRYHISGLVLAFTEYVYMYGLCSFSYITNHKLLQWYKYTLKYVNLE